MNSSFWTQTEGSRPDLLCGMPADYAYGKGHFITLLCSAVVMGGRWLFLNLIFLLPFEPFSAWKVITITLKKRGPMKL